MRTVDELTSVDTMGVTIDWLDAYRAGDLFIVDLYADDASLQCSCGDKKELRGTDAITAYWHQWLVEKPAGELVNLQLDGRDIVLHFRVPGGVVQATLTFDADGSLLRSRCGPLNNQVAA
ncbi:hypothetical protein ACO2JO_17965 [Leptospira interrogans]